MSRARRDGNTITSLLGVSSTDGETTVEIYADPSTNRLFVNSAVVSTVDPALELARGNISGASFVHKFGNAPDFDTADNKVTVWDAAEDGEAWENMLYNYSATAAIDSISSTDDGDTQDIEIQGLDTNYDLVTQTITITGQTRKALDTNLIRVFRLKNVNNTDNAGHIIVYENDTQVGVPGVPDDPELIRAIIQPINNQTLMPIYTIPDGKTGYMTSFFAGTSGAKKTTDYEIDLVVKPFGQVFQVKHRSNLLETGTSHFNHQYQVPEVIPAKADVEMRVASLTTNVTAASVSAGFDLILIDD